jgi:hypothetical protein
MPVHAAPRAPGSGPGAWSKVSAENAIWIYSCRSSSRSRELVTMQASSISKRHAGAPRLLPFPRALWQARED